MKSVVIMTITTTAEKTPALTTGGAILVRDEPNLGTIRPADAVGGPWRPPEGLTYPLTATWTG